MSDAKKAQGRFMVLLALEQGPKHGYEIARYLKDRSDGFFSFSFGALYPVLHKLEKDKLVAASWEDSGATRKKKVYVLTKAGRAELGMEREGYEAFTVALAKLLERKA